MSFVRLKLIQSGRLLERAAYWINDRYIIGGAYWPKTHPKRALSRTGRLLY